MSAPSPVAALRGYVASVGGDIPALDECGVIRCPSEPWTLLRSAPALLAYVERLEAALDEFADASDRYCDAGEKQARYFDAKNAVLALGREIAGRKP